MRLSQGQVSKKPSSFENIWGLSVRQAADLIEISKSRLSRFENNKNKKLDYALLSQLASLYHVSVNSFFLTDDQKKVCSEELEKIISVACIPAFAPAVLEVHSLIEKQASMRKIAAALRKESSLVTFVLKLANAGAFYRSTKIDTVAKAMKKIGLDEIKKIVLMGGVFMALGKLPISGFNVYDFYQACCHKAFFAEYLQKEYKCETPLFAPALLSEVGKPACYIARPQLYRAIRTTENVADYFIEQRSLGGINHVDVSVALLTSWKIPDNIVARY